MRSASFTQTSKMSPTRTEPFHIPPELTDRILAFITDTKTLQDCALVSKEWLPASRILVQDTRPPWISLSVSNRADIERIEDFVLLLESPHSSLAKYTKRVSLSGLKPIIPKVPDLCRAFTLAGIRLTHLEFDGAVDGHKSEHFDPLRLIAMSAQTLRVLVIKNRFMEDFPPFSGELINIVASCTSLEHITVPESIIIDTTSVLEELPFAPSGIHSIKLSPDLARWSPVQPTRLFIAWLIGHAQPASRLIELDHSGARGTGYLFQHISATPAFAARVKMLRFRLSAFSGNVFCQETTP